MVKRTGKKSLCERYRPQSLDEVVGHDDAIKKTKNALRQGRQVWWISGGIGVGKTTLAYIIGNVTEGQTSKRIFKEWSGNEVSAKIVREIDAICKKAGFMPTVVIINEADSLKKSIIQSLLKPLEQLNEQTTVIFTSSNTAAFAKRPEGQALLSRCTQIDLKSDGLEEPFAQRCQEIAQKEKLDGGKHNKVFVKLAKECHCDFRKMLDEIGAGYMDD